MRVPVDVCVFMCVSAGTLGNHKGASDPLGLELRAVVSAYRSSARATCALNRGAEPPPLEEC